MAEDLNKPYFEMVSVLENDYYLYTKWDMFCDKKDDDKFVMRARYVLTKDNERKSLKELNLTLPVVFNQIYVTNDIFAEAIDMDNEYFITKYFIDWVRGDFTDMINSGDYKILTTSI